VRAVVVGGGIAGLAATRLLEAVLPGAEIVLLERDENLGGKIATERVDGFVIEAAPDSFLSRKPRGVGLCDELGLTGELVGRRPENERTFVRRGRDLHLLPSGLTGMIPTNLDALAESELLSLEGRARLGTRAVRPPQGAHGDHHDRGARQGERHPPRAGAQAGDRSRSTDQLGEPRTALFPPRGAWDRGSMRCRKISGWARRPDPPARCTSTARGELPTAQRRTSSLPPDPVS